MITAEMWANATQSTRKRWAAEGLVLRFIKVNSTVTAARIVKPRKPARDQTVDGFASNLERKAAEALELAGLTGYEREHMPFTAIGRKHRIDFAWLEHRIALEVQGGGHGVKEHMTRDAEKLHLLQREGWFIVFATPHDVESGAMVARVRDAMERRIR